MWVNLHWKVGVCAEEVARWRWEKSEDFHWKNFAMNFDVFPGNFSMNQWKINQRSNWRNLLSVFAALSSVIEATSMNDNEALCSNRRGNVGKKLLAQAKQKKSYHPTV